MRLVAYCILWALAACVIFAEGKKKTSKKKDTAQPDNPLAQLGGMADMLSQQLKGMGGDKSGVQELLSKLKDGKLQPDQLQELLKAMQGLTQNIGKQLAGHLDADDSDKGVSKEEFLKSSKGTGAEELHQSNAQQRMEFFEKADTNGDGLLTKAELKEAMTRGKVFDLKLPGESPTGETPAKDGSAGYDTDEL